MNKLRESGNSAVIDVFDCGLTRKVKASLDIQGILMGICGAIGRTPTNNLLSHLNRPKEVNDRQTRARILLVVAVFILMVGALVASILYRKKVEDELQALKDYNESPQMVVDLMDYEMYRNDAARSAADVYSMKYIRASRDTYPVLTSTVIEKLEDTVRGYATVEISSFDATNGTMSFTVSAEKVEDINRFIAELLKIDLFTNVDYTGYSFDEAQKLWDVHVNCIMAESVGRQVD